MHTYIFGYGSLLNPKSRACTFSEVHLIEAVTLCGYERILNAATEADKYVAMNIRPCASKSVAGVVVAVSEPCLHKLKEREAGYEMIDVTENISHDVGKPVFTFMMSNSMCEGKVASHAYLETCLGGVPETEREVWLQETIIEHDIFDDRKAPLCRHYIPLID